MIPLRPSTLASISVTTARYSITIKSSPCVVVVASTPLLSSATVRLPSSNVRLCPEVASPVILVASTLLKPPAKSVTTSEPFKVPEMLTTSKNSKPGSSVSKIDTLSISPSGTPIVMVYVTISPIVAWFAALPVAVTSVPVNSFSIVGLGTTKSASSVSV